MPPCNIEWKPGFAKYVSDNTTIINYASYQAKLILNEDETPTYSSSIHGMWQPERYLTLLMGEIPRLSDNKDGYGQRELDTLHM